MLLDQIQEDLKQAQLERQEIKVSTLRMLVSEIRYSAISKSEDHQEISDEQVTQVILKEAKKRRESIASFEQAGRAELVEKEQSELKVLEAYLPEQMGDEQLGKIVDESISQTGASEVKDMGKVIGMVMGKIKGQADGARVSQLIKERLTK